jgi:plastocyanin
MFLNQPVRRSVDTGMDLRAPANRTLAGLATVASIAAVGLFSGCGGGNSGSGGEDGNGTVVEIADFAFKPATVTVDQGATISFVNRDSADHTATADDHSAFDTGTIKRGATSPVVASQTGTFSYVCDFHPFMKGTVVVK